MNTKEETIQQIEQRLDATLARAKELYAFEEYPMHLAERNAARKNNKADEAAPLLAAAGMVEHITAEKLKEDYDRMNRRYCQRRFENAQEWDARVRGMVRKIGEMVDTETLAAWEEYRVRVYPGEIEYDLEFWRKKMEEANDGQQTR